MKKIVIIFSLLMSAFWTIAQYSLIDYSQYLENYDADTTNLLRPEVFNLPCATNYNLGGNLGPFYSIGSTTLYPIYAIAQPYHTDTTINLDGIVIFDDYWHYADSSYANGAYTCDPTTLYCEILDNKMNVLYHIRYDTINQNSPHSIVKHFQATTFFALNFDRLISVNGDFFVVMSYGKDYIRTDFRGLMAVHGGIFSDSDCDTSIYDYPLPLYQFENDTTWYESGPHTNTRRMAYLTVYPRINYTGQVNHPNSELSSVDISSQTHVFPNPAMEEVNVNCGYKIKNIELYDEQGKLLYTKQDINAYNHKISLNDYPQGTYFIKILTKTGQTTKKIIKK